MPSTVTLNQLVNNYLPKKDLNEALNFNATQGIVEIEIDGSINEFLAKFKKGSDISATEFKSFSEKISKLDKRVTRSIMYMVFEMSNAHYEKLKDEFGRETKKIEQDLNTSGSIHRVNTADSTTKYMGLINSYYLFAKHIPVDQWQNGHSYPNASYDAVNSVLNIPFAINAFTLTGKLSPTKYNEMDTAKPLYPFHLQQEKGGKLEIKQGIKESEQYFPYKQVEKIVRGDTGDNTFLATNGKKKLFMRGVKQYSPQGILASKIATLISAKHFASERLMDNKIIASKGLEAYAYAANDRGIRNLRKKYIEDDKKVFPGTGIIDEVTNYIYETDSNIENIGLSSKIDQLSKIDFDRCYLSVPITKENYERNIVSRTKVGIYHGLDHVQEDKEYIREKLSTRLKLSLITEPLLRGLADKAFMAEDRKLKEDSIKESSKRSDIALELFVEHKDAKQLLINNPNLLNQCYKETADYIKEHFKDKTQQEPLLRSLQERVNLIRSKLADQLGVQIEVQYTTQQQEARQPERKFSLKEPIHQEELNKKLGANINLQGPGTGWSPAHVAAKRSDLDNKDTLKNIESAPITPIQKKTVQQQNATLPSSSAQLPENKKNQHVKSNYYPYQTNSPHKKRFHAFEVNTNNCNSLKEKYQDAKGDYLKSSILSDFQKEIENTTSKAELDKLVQELKLKPEYKILEKGQGIATKVFGLETSSVKAFNKMVDEQGENLLNKENKMK